MRFTLDESHDDFAASLDALLSKADIPKVARGWADGDTEPGLSVWRKLADSGVPGLLVDEERGGVGGDALDMVVAVEQLGRHCMPGPVAETVAVAPALLDSDGERLEQLAAGALATVAMPPQTPYAVDAHAAALTLLAVDGVVTTGEVGTGAGKTSVDPTRTLFDVAAGSQIGPADVPRAFDLGALATAAQLQGLGRAMLEATTDYAKQRRQFGRAIGSQQAVKHQLAEAAVGLEMSRPLLLAAALSARDGGEDARRDISAAKVACGDAAQRTARVALQVHGAIGYTRECDVSLYLTKTRALLTAWGTPALHRARVMEALV